MIEPARRVQALPPYVFLELQQWRDAARDRGVDVIDLSVGNPDGEVPPAALDTLSKKLTKSIRKKPDYQFPETSDNCEWAGVATMRTEWEKGAPGRSRAGKTMPRLMETVAVFSPGEVLSSVSPAEAPISMY